MSTKTFVRIFDDQALDPGLAIVVQADPTRGASIREGIFSGGDKPTWRHQVYVTPDVAKSVVAAWPHAEEHLRAHHEPYDPPIAANDRPWSQDPGVSVRSETTLVQIQIAPERDLVALQYWDVAMGAWQDAILLTDREARWVHEALATTFGGTSALPVRVLTAANPHENRRA